MSKHTKEDNDTSLLAMENHLFDRLFDAMKDQSQAMHASMEHFSPHPNKPTMQYTQDDEKSAATIFIRTNQLYNSITTCPLLVITRNHCTLALHTPAVPLLV
jgi:hypothetical protein